MKVKVLPWMICALVALFVVPALANGDSHAARENVDAAFVVFDNGFHEDGRPLDDNTVNITPGGRVTFSYPVGFSVHNADFEETPPTSCVQTAAGAGSTIEPAPPLPAGVQSPGWEGSCLFQTTGVYTFLCVAHPNMTGTVIVGTPTPTPTPTATPTSTPTATPTATPTVTPDRPAHRGARRHRFARVLVAGRVAVEPHRQQRHDQGRRARHVRATRPERACTTCPSRGRRRPTTCPQTKAATGSTRSTPTTRRRSRASSCRSGPAGRATASSRRPAPTASSAPCTRT